MTPSVCYVSIQQLDSPC